MKKKLTKSDINEVLGFLQESYFTNFTKFDTTTLIKRNGPFLLCITIDESRDRTSFQIVRHIHFLVSESDFIGLSAAYRATNRKGRIPRVIDFTNSNANIVEEVSSKFEEDIDNFSILQSDELVLNIIIVDFDNYFSDGDRCDAQYQSKLFFYWLLTLSTVMNELDFEPILEKNISKLSEWQEAAFRSWGGYKNFKVEIDMLLNDSDQIQKMINKSLSNLSIEQVVDFGIKNK